MDGHGEECGPVEMGPPVYLLIVRWLNATSLERCIQKASKAAVSAHCTVELPSATETLALLPGTA